MAACQQCLQPCVSPPGGAPGLDVSLVRKGFIGPASARTKVRGSEHEGSRPREGIAEKVPGEGSSRTDQ